MRINGQVVVGDCFAYDGCHKIYICEDSDDIERMENYGYTILPIYKIVETWNNSCPFRFIYNAKIGEGEKRYVEQCEEAITIEL